MVFIENIIDDTVDISSKTKTFVVSGDEQVEIFANAIEESYEESLYRTQALDLKITRLNDANDIKEFLMKQN